MSKTTSLRSTSHHHDARDDECDQLAGKFNCILPMPGILPTEISFAIFTGRARIDLLSSLTRLTFTGKYSAQSRPIHAAVK